jgi:hypothetical protein
MVGERGSRGNQESILGGFLGEILLGFRGVEGEYMRGKLGEWVGPTARKYREFLSFFLTKKCGKLWGVVMVATARATAASWTHFGVFFTFVSPHATP